MASIIGGIHRCVFARVLPVLAIALLSHTAIADDNRSVGKLRLTTLRSGYALSIISTGDTDPIEGQERMSLDSGSTQRLLKDLGDLKGIVSINTSKDALNFVRLRTSRATWYMWGGVPTVEMIEWHRGVQIESYGVYSYAQADKPVGFPWGVPAWRMKQAGFTPAKVETSGASYVVTRWLLVEAMRHKGTYQRVEETVGSDGSYSCRILKQVKASAVRGADWTIPRFL